jgi:hypothetical protein
MPTSDDDPKTRDDVVLVHGRSEDGRALAILRKQGDTLSAGVLTAAEEGKPLHGELVRLRPREESPALFDVDVLHAPPKRPGDEARRGPAQVSTQAYRDGWNAAFLPRAKDPDHNLH